MSRAASKRGNSEPARRDRKGVGGRPSTYKPEYAEQVRSMGRRGYTVTMMAAEIGVRRKTLYHWAQTIAEFGDAFAHARELALAWWERQGLDGVWGGKDFNAQHFAFMAGNMFPQHYRQQKHVEIRGLVGRLDIHRLTDDQLARIAAGESPLSVLGAGAAKQLPAGREIPTDQSP